MAENDAIDREINSNDESTSRPVSSRPESNSLRSVQPTPVSETLPLLHENRFLDPDDPLVSPLNLYKVRLSRTVVLVLIALNCILWLGFLISDFVSIPGLNNDSFLELDLALVNLLTNLITLWWFDIPAYYERVLGYVSLFLILIDALVIFVFQGNRLDTLFLSWTAANIAYNCFADYYVEKERHYQEIRYTGRIEKRKSIGELLVIAIKCLVKLALLLVVWNISLTLWLGAFDTHEKPWGKLVSIEDDLFKVHLACFGLDKNTTDFGAFEDVNVSEKPPKDPEGRRQPIILVEGGQLTSSEEFQEWIEELYHLNKIERYCIWDRPGYGWSESAPSPLLINIVTEYLMEALAKENIEGPFALVGFDIGGLYSRMFASKNVAKVHSLLLVDSWHEDLLQKRPFSGPSRKNEDWRVVYKNKLELMNTRTGLKLWLRGVLSPLGTVTNLHWFFHPRRYSSKSRIFGRDMYYSSRYVRARLQEQITSLILSYNEIRRSEIHNIPLSVILSDFMIKNSLNWGKWQRELSKLSDKTMEWVIAEKSDHFIWKSPRGKEQLQELLLRMVSEERLN